MSGTQDGNFCRRLAQRFRVRWRQINTSEVKRLDEESETESPTLCEASPRLQVTDGQPVLCPGCWKEGRAGGRGVFSQQAEGVCVAPILSPVCLQQHTHTHSHTHACPLPPPYLCWGARVFSFKTNNREIAQRSQHIVFLRLRRCVFLLFE